MSYETNIYKMTPYSMTLKIAGEAGDGIKLMGEVIACVAARLNFETSVYSTYPSNLKGGDSISVITISESPIICPIHDFHILVALNKEGYEKNKKILSIEKILILDAVYAKEFHQELNELTGNNHKILMTPIRKMTLETFNSTRYKNILTLGIIAYILDLPRKDFQAVLRGKLCEKGEIILKNNLKAFNMGYNHIAESG